jgi:hypothetical protein
MRSLDQVIAELPPERRAKVLARSRELIAEEIARSRRVVNRAPMP